ncbi:MAG TPA: cupin domain-containing protein [Candidatus Nanopelagicales bacterium]
MSSERQASEAQRAAAQQEAAQQEAVQQPGGMTYQADLGELIAVAPEATVSRTVLRGDGVRVVLFAFDAGQELTEHTAAVPVLLGVLDGRLEVAAAGSVVELVPGGLIHLGARVPHEVRAMEPSRMVLTMLDPRQHAPTG